MMPRRHVVSTAILVMVLGTTATTATTVMGKEPPKWETWQRAVAYANQVVAPTNHYWTREARVETGTVRGGVVRGSWMRKELVLLTFTVGLPNKDLVDRFIFARGKIVSMEQYEIPFNAAKNLYEDRHPRKFRRFLITHYTAVCQDDVMVQKVRDVTAEERGQLLTLQQELFTFREILWKKGKQVKGTSPVTLLPTLPTTKP